MNCPIDNNKLIKKKYENSIEVDYCDSCQGIWLDSGELEKIQEIKKNDFTSELKRIPDYVGNAIMMAKSKIKPPINCPVCGVELERKEYGLSSQIMIDSCIRGHGIWLDKDEVNALEVFYERCRIEANDMRKGFFASLLDYLK